MTEEVIEKTGEQELEEALTPQSEVKVIPEEEAKPEVKEEAKEEVKAEKPEDDPELDLGLDKEGKPRKLKRSQVLEWEKNSMLQADYTKKTQEIAAEKAQIKEFYDIIEHLKNSPKKAKKIVELLDMKEEDIKEEVEQIEEKQEDIEALLKDLPDDDPYAKALRSQSKMIGESKKQLQELMKMNKDLQDKLTQGKQTEEAAKSAEENAKVQEQAKQVLNNTLGELTKEFDFVDEEEMKDWKDRVLSFLVNNPKKYETEEDFTATIKEVGKKAFESIKKLGEKHVKRYIEKKNKGPAVPGEGGPGGKPKEKELNMDNLNENIEAALQEEKGKAKE